MSLVEPFFPNNRAIAREYSQIWSFWRDEHNPKTGASSQSLLWNLYRRDKTPEDKKVSLLFGLIQCESTANSTSWRLFYLPRIHTKH